jgi:hypothetical protein
MEKAILAFDLETHKIIPEGEALDRNKHSPLGISCASIVGSNGIYQTFCHLDLHGDPSPDKMDRNDLEFMLEEIEENIEDDYLLTTWNGAAFDFSVMLEEMGETFRKRLEKLCLGHWDIMFHFLSLQGFPVGLNTVAKTMGFSGKTEGMHGDLAPAMWQKGVSDRKLVLDYVLQDSITTLQVAEAIIDRERISWTSKKGMVRSLLMRNYLTVAECIKLPDVDQSWMDKPLIRDEMLAWMNA